MARGRIVSSTLGRSRKFNALPDHFTKLVYVLTLTHADVKGRIEADPDAIYGDSFVLDPDATPERIEAALVDLHRVGLIVLYDVGGKAFAEFVDFLVHNTIRRWPSGPRKGLPKSEAESRRPDPSGVLPSWVPARTGDVPVHHRGATGTPPVKHRGDTGDVPEEVEVEGKVQVQDEVEERTSSPDGDAPPGPAGGEEPGEGAAPTPPAEDSEDAGDSALATRASREDGSAAPARAGGPTLADVQAVVDAYNEHRGTLPEAVSVNERRERQIKALVRRYGRQETVALMGVAASEVAHDPWWQQHRYGIDNLLAGQKLVGKFEAARARGTTDRSDDLAARYLAALQRSV